MWTNEWMSTLRKLHCTLSATAAWFVSLETCAFWIAKIWVCMFCCCCCCWLFPTYILRALFVFVRAYICMYFELNFQWPRKFYQKWESYHFIRLDFFPFLSFFRHACALLAAHFIQNVVQTSIYIWMIWWILIEWQVPDGFYHLKIDKMNIRITQTHIYARTRTKTKKIISHFEIACLLHW